MKNPPSSNRLYRSSGCLNVPYRNLAITLSAFVVLLNAALPSANGDQNKFLGIFPRKSPDQQDVRLPTRLPAEVRQLLVATADDWNSHRATLRVYHKPRQDSSWQPALFTEPVPVLLGSKGLAWGRGALLNPLGHSKQEKDGRAPAGCFSIGRLYGYADQPPQGTAITYHQVGPWDAWPDDPGNPHYNRHVVIDPRRGIPQWFEKQKMRHGDFAYEWLLEIRHNASPPLPGAGSAIFFHIRRGPDRPTSGCTTMEKSNLIRIIQWLRPQARPHYVLLPLTEYKRLQPHWSLPPLAR